MDVIFVYPLSPPPLYGLRVLILPAWASLVLARSWRVLVAWPRQKRAGHVMVYMLLTYCA